MPESTGLRMDIQTVAPDKFWTWNREFCDSVAQGRGFQNVPSEKPGISPIHSHLGWPLPLGPHEAVTEVPLCQCRGDEKLFSLSAFSTPEAYANTTEAGVLGGSEEERGFKRVQGRQLTWRLQGPMLSKEICFP